MQKSFKLQLARVLLAAGVAVSLTTQALGGPVSTACPPDRICPAPVAVPTSADLPADAPASGKLKLSLKRSK